MRSTIIKTVEKKAGKERSWTDVAVLLIVGMC
jgi:hypothetical protein